MFTKGCRVIILFFLFLTLNPFPALCAGQKLCKVLVVMSYHESISWESGVRDGIEAALGETCEIRYRYLDTKYNFDRAAERAVEAYRFYQEYQPDGVLAVDDDAQSFFVVPYLKNKVETPVVFCGVNAEPEKYGYPASNVTGVLERAHFRESIAFLRQLVPTVHNICYLIADNPTGRSYYRQLTREAVTYPLKPAAIRMVTSLEQAKSVSRQLVKTCDSLFLITLEGLKDAAGVPLSEKDIFPVLVKSFNKPVIGVNAFSIRFGLLCAVVKSSREQGSMAARMLLAAMQGTSLSSLPITRNSDGKRMINVTVMKEMGIKARPVVLRGAELVTTIE
ncbi:MAG: ABC transporter substrate binding protein [Geobacteraceae bacterium]|nr:ABC transporter substrate binding protein [Geobacteraceae bacterium]